MNNETLNTMMPETPDWDEVKNNFVAAWHDGEQPSLHEWAQRHPDFAAHLADFVPHFVAMENAAARETRNTAPIASTTREAIMHAIRQTSAIAAESRVPMQTLAEARKARGWRLDQLASALNVPDWIALQLERGALRDWPAKLEERLSAALETSRAQIAAMLQASIAAPQTAAAHFHAEDAPASNAPVVRSFREALEACAQQGKLSDEQQREWLDESSV